LTFGRSEKTEGKFDKKVSYFVLPDLGL